MTAAPPLIALVGNPNAGKSALFNALTGARQKIANYPGVTVERKSGRMFLSDGRPVEMLDLPGSYSLTADSLDEKVTRDVVLGTLESQRRPDALIVVLDATNLENHLRFCLELLDLDIPTVVALNMVDLATRDGLTIDPKILSAELGVPVMPTVAVRRKGLDELKAIVEPMLTASRADRARLSQVDELSVKSHRKRAHAIAAKAIVEERETVNWTRRIDSVLLHPIAGFVILLALLFVIFQAVFSWSAGPIGWIEDGFEALASGVAAVLPPGLLHLFDSARGCDDSDSSLPMPEPLEEETHDRDLFA